MENMNEDRIVDKIKKLLSLAGNNTSEAEANAAALKAQELMAKHNISVSSVETQDADEMKIEKLPTEAGMKWKKSLASVIAKNFRCKTFSYGRTTLAFYGRGDDAAIAKEVFSYLLKTGHKLGMKARAEYKKQTGTGDGAYNSFVLGFLRGIDEKLGEQSTALLVIIPQEVEDEFSEFIKGAKTSSHSFSQPINPSIFNRGVREGRSALENRQ